jgi:hypothetical protein
MYHTSLAISDWDHHGRYHDERVSPTFSFYVIKSSPVLRGLWLRISRQCLTCALGCGRGIVFRHNYRSLAKSAGKDFLRDGAVAPFA